MIRLPKFVVITAFLFAVTFSSPFSVQAGTPSCTLCDINGNGTIESPGVDFDRFIEILLNPSSATPEEFCAADVNQDGFVNGLDIQTWINICYNVCNSDAECDDSIDCTVDTCIPATGCVHTPNDALCPDDGVSCTQAVCSSMFGCSQQPDDGLCNDGIPCTQDVCDVNADCSNLPVVCGPNQVCHPDSGQCVPEGICGNGILEPGEECEFDGDCTGGGVCAGCSCVASNFCGDGKVTGDEVCDVNGNIGCASGEGYVCEQICLSDCSDCDPSGGQPSCCGDGVIDSGEDCDAGSFCSDGSQCFYQNECFGIGDEVCQYREEFSDGCSEACANSQDFVLAGFDRNAPSAASASSMRMDRFYSVKSEGQCVYSYSREDALGSPKGGSLKIDYDIQSNQKPGCKITVGISSKLFEISGADPNRYKTLKFYLKGDSKHFPKELKAEWRGAALTAHSVVAKNIAADWQLYSVPLAGILEPGESPEFSLTLERNIEPKAGVFYLDQISLSRPTSPVWPGCSGKACLQSKPGHQEASTPSSE